MKDSAMYLQLKEEVERNKKWKVVRKRQFVFIIIALIVLVVMPFFHDDYMTYNNQDRQYILYLYLGYGLLLFFIYFFILPIQKKPVVSHEEIKVVSKRHLEKVSKEVSDQELVLEKLKKTESDLKKIYLSE